MRWLRDRFNCLRGNHETRYPQGGMYFCACGAWGRMSDRICRFCGGPGVYEHPECRVEYMSRPQPYFNEFWQTWERVESDGTIVPLRGPYD